LAFGTVSDPLLAAALWTACGALTITALLLAAIVVARVRLLRRLEHERRAAALWNPLLAECAERVPDPLPALAARDVEAFLVLWCRAQESLRGEAQDHLRAMAHRLGVEPHTQRLLRSGRLRLELLAMVTLGHLRDRAVVPLLQKLIPAAPSMVALTAAHALLRIDPKLGVPRLLAAIALRDDFPLAGVVSILKECDPRLIGPMLALAIRTELGKRDAGDGVARLLRLHVTAHGEALRPAVLEVLAAAGGSEALAAALGALWHPQDVEYARRLLGHAGWTVRVAAARALGRFGGREDFARLEGALADPSWWVRYRAAHALCQVPGIGAEDIVALLGRLTDRFAADTLRQALADRRSS
jgi:hypothetical protein